MKHYIDKLIQKYNINMGKILVFLLLFAIFLIRFLVQNNIAIKPIHVIFDLYSDFLIACSKSILYLFNREILFDYSKNQIISNGYILKIDRFFFSLNQIIFILILVLITKSPIKNKVLTFIVAFFIISFYNVLRISLHSLYPDTVAVHNWFFNLILIPRWIIVVVFIHYYWKKFPDIKEIIIRKFSISEEFVNRLFLKIIIIIVCYYIVIIFAYNDIFIVNGSLLIAAILNTSKHLLELLGYTCWINNRLIYGVNVSLYMDDACLGINLMFLFASFIVLLPGSARHKLWYIPLGIIAIVMLNCIRIVMIFVNIKKYGKYSFPFEIHDLFTYPVLVFTLFLWIIWINKFFKSK
jgi:exosortase/archaeosortase family protein